MNQQDPLHWVTGLNEPNVMTPGAWVILGVVVACILAGCTWLFVQYWTKIRVPWTPLAGYRQAKVFVEPGNTTYSAARLVACLQKSEELLKTATQYTAAQFDTAFQKVCIYVKKDNAWVEGGGQKVAGEEEGGVVVIGADFAALLHEEGHLLEEFIDKMVDYDHTTWPRKGFAVADEAFQQWLKTT